MHPGAFEFVSTFATHEPLTVIEIGSRDINGTVRPLFPAANYLGLDLHAGPCVDVVCNATTFTPHEPVDMVVCCEVLEHAENWRWLLSCGARWLRPGGRLVVTCAGDGREPHSGIDGAELRSGEYYGNVSREELHEVLTALELGEIVTATNKHWRDTYGTGRKMI